MRRFLPTSVAAVCLCLTVWPAVRSAGGAEIEPAGDAPQALTPAESIRRFRLPEGFRIELVAAEPHVADPVAMAFDAQGRIFVCEIHGYNLEGYLDAVELNKTGVLDKQVRRIPANRDAIRRAEQEQYGTVKLLDDTDGDGRIDRAVVWADRLPPCYGIVPAGDGVIVLCAPDIVYLQDRDGDGQADHRETLFTGFGVGELWTRINHPRWSIDNWIYGVSGAGSGGTIRGPRLAEPVRIGSVCFRFRPDGTAIEPCSGRTSGFGQAINDWGDRFLCTNQQHTLQVAPLPHRYLLRNPFHAAPNPTVNICSYGHPARVYPTSQPDPWRLARSQDPAWMRFYGAAEATANGFFTAASGPTIYQAASFPSEYVDNHFSVDNAQNLVHRCVLQRNGCLYRAVRAGDEQTEFLTSNEQWFRPVDLSVGPDGALYVVDMYRAIIEDYSAIPRFLQQLYADSLIAGADRGRIWRIVHEDSPPPRRIDLASATLDDLTAALADSNAWTRQTVQRLLVERGDEKAVPLLRAQLKQTGSPQARLHCLYTLHGLAALTPEQICRALTDSHFALRVHGLRLAEAWLDENRGVTDAVLALGDDDDRSVQLQLALTLGASGDPRALATLADLARRHGSDRWVQAAILTLPPERADRLLVALVGTKEELHEAVPLLGPLSAVIGARREDSQLAQVLTTIADRDKIRDASRRLSCMKGLVEGLRRGKPTPLKSSLAEAALHRLLVDSDPPIRNLAVQIASLVELPPSERMKEVYDAAATVAADPQRAIEERCAALGVLTGASFDQLAGVAGPLVDPRQPLGLQLAAVAALSASRDSRVSAVLLKPFRTLTPNVRAAVLAAIFGRENRLSGLLDAIETGTVLPTALDPTQRRQLTGSRDAGIRKRAASLFEDRPSRAERAAVVDKYAAALNGPRDAAHGLKVFDKQCAKCHRLENRGFQVGPELSTAKNRADETILADILDPNRQITVGFRNYTVITDDGRIFTGVLAAETATGITLRKEEGKESVILRRNIDEIEASPLSIMPEGLEKEVSPRDLADLIGYLRRVLGAPPPDRVTLFDDAPEFPSLLTEGDGTVGLSRDAPHSGPVCLTVMPPQRWSLKIPGWKYPIREHPAPGEYRYLRFAWKSRGHGVMIELAADGRWPPADKPIHRYYSGRNTTGWAAVQVAEEAPRSWSVITRDLYADFGEFTLTGIAPTAMGGAAQFDRIELLRVLERTTNGHE